MEPVAVQQKLEASGQKWLGVLVLKPLMIQDRKYRKSLDLLPACEHRKWI